MLTEWGVKGGDQKLQKHDVELVVYLSAKFRHLYLEPAGLSNLQFLTMKCVKIAHPNLMIYVRAFFL